MPNRANARAASSPPSEAGDVTVSTTVATERLAWHGGAFAPGVRQLTEETAIAVSYNGSTHAVLMATPADLDDFAVGFSLTEGVIDGIEVIERIVPVTTDLGIDLQVWLRDDVAERLAARRRSMAGPVGCGLCGVESLDAAMRTLPRLASTRAFAAHEVCDAVTALARSQPLNDETRAVHAAGFFLPERGLVAAREDAGRHNALDKLIGALARDGVDANAGAIVVTSRVSVEIVQKTAMARCGALFAVSAPTALAVRTADAAGIVLAAVVRGSEFELFTHPERIFDGARPHVA